MSQLQKIIYLTRQQYETLLSNNNTGQVTYGGVTLTGVQDNNIYFITDETVSAADLGNDFVLPVNKGGTGKDSFTIGSVLVGNGNNPLTELGATNANTGNTLVKRDASGNFNAGTITASLTGHASADLALSGGTMTGVLTAKGSQYTDAYSGALNMNNSNIYGLNSIYTADASENASEGIHFYRDGSHTDTLWMSGGNIYFVPNRSLAGTSASTSAANSEKVTRLPATINGSRAIYTDSTSGKLAESSTTSTELSYVHGVTSAIQTQLNGKQSSLTFDGTYDASSNKAATVSTVTNAINALDGGTIGTGSTTKTITSLSQTNGNVSATFSDIAFPVSSVAGLSGAITANNLTEALGLSKALRFVGITTTDMTGGTATNHTYTGTPAGISNYTPIVGDVVINSTKQDEWVCTAVSGTTYTWERLGSDTSYKIVQSAVSDPTAASTTSTTFIDTISQDANGVISATKNTLPTASTSVAGIIKIGTGSTDAMAGNTNVTNVAFTAATDDNEYPILLKNSTGSTTTAASAKFANTTNKMTTINPSTGIITAPGLKISSNAATAHLAFSRTGWNYITMPNNDSSVISIGYGTPADNTTQRLVIYKTGTVRPGTNGSQNLGDDTHKWNNVYGVNFYGSTFSGTANKANYLRCFELAANDDLNLIDSHTDEGIFQNCWVGGGDASSIQNKPDSYGVASFGMLAFKIATNWTGQVLLSTNQAPGLYWRVNNNSNSPAYGTWARVWDSSNHRVFYGTCTEAAGTVAKTAACANYDEMKVGDIITVKFNNTNTAASPTLNVNGKGSKPIKMAYSGGYADLSSYAQLTGIRTFIYDGTNWILQEGECVKQEVTNGSESVWRGLMVGASNNASESFTPDPIFAKTYVTHNVKFQASTGTLRATKFKGTEFKLEYEHTDKAYMTWNNTDQSIDFIFV